MAEVSDTFHLVQLPNGAWCYRRRVPKPLIERFGKPIIKIGLGTTSKAQAKKKRAVKDLKYDAIFDALVRNPEAKYDPEQGVVCNAAPAKGAVLELVREYVKRLDAIYERDWLDNPLVDNCEMSEAKSDIDLELAIAREHAPSYDHEEYIARCSRDIVGAWNPQATPDAPSNAAIYGLVKRARIEVLRRQQARLNDDHRRIYFDKLFDPALSAPVTVGELAGQYMEIEKENAAHIGKNENAAGSHLGAQ